MRAGLKLNLEARGLRIGDVRMKKREIHALDSLIASLVTKLDMVLRLDEKFLEGCARKKHGINLRIDEKFMRVGKSDWATQIVVAPKWWPKETKMYVSLVSEGHGEYVVMVVSLDVPQFARVEASRFTVALQTSPNPPYFFKDKLSSVNDECMNRFEMLSRQLYRAFCSQDLRNTSRGVWW